MCTIMTFSREEFLKHDIAIVEQIRRDSVGNPHGMSLILISEEPSELKAHNVEQVIDHLTQNEWNRFFLHCRFATGSYLNLPGIHGWASTTGWMVHHNGILHHPEAQKLPVDSILIAHLLDYMDVEDVATWLTLNESYANVFMIHPEEWKYYVVRCVNGSLYEDKKGNYSSNSIKGVCDEPVPQKSISGYDIPGKPAPIQSLKGIYGKWDDYDDHRYASWNRLNEVEDKLHIADEYSGHVSDFDIDNKFLRKIRKQKYTIDEFVDIFISEEWDYYGVPDEVEEAARGTIYESVLRQFETSGRRK